MTVTVWGRPATVGEGDQTTNLIPHGTTILQVCRAFSHHRELTNRLSFKIQVLGQIDNLRDHVVANIYVSTHKHFHDIHGF